jgi:hypothetical protein
MNDPDPDPSLKRGEHLTGIRRIELPCSQRSDLRGEERIGGEMGSQ